MSASSDASRCSPNTKYTKCTHISLNKTKRHAACLLFICFRARFSFLFVIFGLFLVGGVNLAAIGESCPPPRFPVFVSPDFDVRGPVYQVSSENFDRNYSQVVCWKKLTVIENYQIWYKLQKYKYIFILIFMSLCKHC